MVDVVGVMTIVNSIAQDNGRAGIWLQPWVEHLAHRASGNILCGNGLYGIALSTPWLSLGAVPYWYANAEANWWGDASGPEHPSNPDGTGDAVGDKANGYIFGHVSYRRDFDDPGLGRVAMHHRLLADGASDEAILIAVRAVAVSGRRVARTVRDEFGGATWHTFPPGD